MFSICKICDQDVHSEKSSSELPSPNTEHQCQGCVWWLYPFYPHYGYKSSIFGDCISSNIWYWEYTHNQQYTCEKRKNKQKLTDTEYCKAVHFNKYVITCS
jgi:hypothetical protein